MSYKDLTKRLRQAGLISLLGLSTLMPPTSYSAPQPVKRQITPVETSTQSKDKKWEFSVGPFFQYSAAKPGEDFLNDEMQKIQRGDYTSGTTQILTSNLEAEKLNALGVEGSVLYNFSNKFSAGLVLGYSSKKQSSSGQGIDSLGAGIPIYSSYNWKINMPSIGLKEKVRLSRRLNLNLEQEMTLNSINGNSNVHWTNPNSGITRNYDATFDGSGNSLTFRAGLEYDLIKHFSIGTSANYTTGKVNTKGTQIQSRTNWTTTTSTEYNPSFDLSGFGVSGSIKVRF